MRLGSKRYILATKSKRKKLSSFFTFFIILMLVTGMLIYALTVMRPAFSSLAQNRAKELASRIINEAISDKIASERTEYSDIVEFERDNDNNISAVKSNLSGISKLKSDLTLKILEKISSIDQSTLKVPLGSIMGNDIFVGCGPQIPFSIKPFGTAVCDIKTDFTDVGINQTKLDVTVTVKADLSVLMPTMQKVSTVTTTVPIVQTVIVGDVPGSFTHVDRDGLDYEDDVLQLAE